TFSSALTLPKEKRRHGWQTETFGCGSWRQAQAAQVDGLSSDLWSCLPSHCYGCGGSVAQLHLER
ncbi:MAG TPA: hypothetical protein VFZ34_11135, partial [Blastocatellia bacterium]|nr:hypothetical protein [Blastocatellia bacterium]